jgi:predicted AAA+ superfamily ATPase
MGATIAPAKTRVIFDEIQECNRALNSLKYFCEDAPEYHVVAAGSFLGIALHENESFPVGKTDRLSLYPMTFGEFLDAAGEQTLITALDSGEARYLALVKDSLIKYLKYYFYVGGMPEAVLAFSRERNIKKIRDIQKRILSDYEDDFSKHTGMESGERVLRLWNSIPAQLARENKKFIYAVVKPGAKSRNYRSPLFWLTRCGLVYDVRRVSAPRYPLISYEDENVFKLYMLDVGLLSAMCALDVEMFLEPDAAIFNHFHGALTEQYVLQELKAAGDIPVYYWAREGSAQAEVDFVIQYHNMVIPIEAKATRNLKAKSFNIYLDTYQPKAAIRTSLADVSRNGAVYEIPLYAVGGLREWMGKV